MFAVAVGGVLVPTSAQAAETVVTVSGHNLAAAGLRLVHSVCGQPLNPAWWSATPKRLAGGVLGSHAVGWHSPTNNEAGPAVFVDKPGQLTVFDASVYSPTGSERGEIIAFYDESGGFDNTAWVGIQQLPLWNDVGGTGWQRFRLDQVGFKFWAIQRDVQGNYQFTGSSYPGTFSLAGFDFERSSPSTSDAQLSFMMGCSGNAWYMDQLTVGNSANVTTYDFEGLPAGAHIWNDNGAGQLVRGHGSVTIDIGKGTWLAGHVWAGNDGQFDAPTNNWVDAGHYDYFARPYGAPGFSPVSGGQLQRTESAYYFAAPKRQTAYDLRYAGSDKYEGSVSKQVVVSVRSALKAKVTDRSLVAGKQKLAVRGQIYPGDRGRKVILQRKVKKSWRTLQKKSTSVGGRFSFSVPVQDPGTWKVRVKLTSGAGTLGTKSTTKTLHIKKFVPPPPPKKKDKPDYVPPAVTVATPQPVLVADPPVTVRPGVPDSPQPVRRDSPMAALPPLRKK